MPSPSASVHTDPVALIDDCLTRAWGMRASDLHFEPTDGDMLVRCRLDGHLQSMGQIPRDLSDRVIARLKVMAGLLTYRIDIPQEGGLRYSLPNADDQAVTLRVATFPTVRGERAVVRLFHHRPLITELEDLNLPPTVAQRLERLALIPQGLLAVTGPAGSGKSTTLYALLRRIQRERPGSSILTLEDPVEQWLEGVTQIQVRPHGELDYPRAMRSLLRQDPQVLMIGEVRDAQTAETVIQAAVTGHLVLTTMHSGDPAETYIRLLEMGVPAYQLASALSAVCSQRLLRKLCLHCRQETGNPDDPFRAAGCPACHQTGYAGRVPIASLVETTDPVRDSLMRHSDAASLRKTLYAQGDSLFNSARVLLAEGLTSADEVALGVKV